MLVVLAPSEDATVTFTEDWFCEASQVALAGLYTKVADLPGAIVEIGCWEGRSTVALANACQPHLLHAVDTWKGSPGEISEALAADRDVFGTFLANIEILTEGNVLPHRCGWRDFMPHVKQLKFLHIDAEHSYVEVRDTIAAALPKMVPGGIICGDDVHHPPIQEAVLEAFPKANVVATLWWVQCY